MSNSAVVLILVAVAVLLIGGGLWMLTRRRPPEDAVSEREEQSGGTQVAEDREVEVAPPVEVEEATPEERVEAPVPAAEPEPRATLRERLAKSRRFLTDRLADAFGSGDDTDWDDIEAVLIQADIGVKVATRITEDLKNKAKERKVKDAATLHALLADELVELFDPSLDRTLKMSPETPTVWLVVGVNGTGKTTTIGKLAKDLTDRGRKVALAASDTFRAAADEQLTVWGERTGAHVVKHQPGADPGAVAFDALKYAKARDFDALIVDTAGRLHTKQPLMDELAKIRRVIEKEGKVDETLLILDATAGQNGLAQAREFAQAAGVSGIVLTKLDGTAKGGIALSVEEELGIPIKLIGVGEGVEDLEPFDPKTFADALLA